MLAKVVRADGVHLGKDDLDRFPLEVARDIIGRDRIIGVSTGSSSDFEKANESDADYIGFGPIFPTKVKTDPIGTADIEYIMEIAKKPVFFIGGITLTNIEEVLKLGGRNIALMRGITEEKDIGSSARKFKERLQAQKDLIKKTGR